MHGSPIRNMTCPRVTRWLRISWTAVWVFAAVLLICLWVRSYRWIDYFGRRNGNYLLSAQTMPGSIQALYAGPFPNGGYQNEWNVFRVTGKTDRDSFHWKLSRSNCLVRFPIWLMVIVCSAISAAPWLPWWSKRFSSALC